MNVAAHLPAVTPAQRLALAQWIVGLAVALGAPLSPTVQGELVGATSFVFALLVAADTALRRARVQHVGPLLAGKPSLAAGDVALIAAAVVDELAAAPAPAVRPATRLGDAVAATGREFAAAELANGPPPAPGTYPLDDEPPPASTAVVDTASPPPLQQTSRQATPTGDTSPAPPAGVPVQPR